MSIESYNLDDQNSKHRTTSTSKMLVQCKASRPKKSFYALKTDAELNKRTWLLLRIVLLGRNALVEALQVGEPYSTSFVHPCMRKHETLF